MDRFGGSIEEARKRYHAFLQEGIDGDISEDILMRLVMNSNAGVQSGRSVGCWIIGDQSFVKKALGQSEANRLGISRFEREGKDLDAIAETIASSMGVDIESIRNRGRGGKASEARKAFVFTAVKEYNAPSRMVAEYCGVGQAAISALAKAGREFVPEEIKLF
jgi:hypothetical protein